MTEKYIMPKMEILSFNTENILTESSVLAPTTVIGGKEATGLESVTADQVMSFE